MTDAEFVWWRIVGRIKHWFGIHTWVPREDWHLIEGNIDVHIIGFICWRCPATRDL